MINNEFLKNCWAMVRLLQKPVLIVESFNGFQVFICDNFHSKGRDFFQNEVTGGQDVTDLISSVEMHMAANNKYSIESRIESLPKIDFSFGHDSFSLLKSIR